MPFPKIVHIIADMNGFGGTEATLLRYILGSGLPRECHHVIVLKSVGVGNTLGAQMVAAGIAVQALGQKRGSISPLALLRLYRMLKQLEPDVLSGWLYHPSLLASVFGYLLKHRPAVVWHIRSSSYGSLLTTPGRYVVQRLLSLLSHRTNPVLVSNSRAAVAGHAAVGFDVRPERWEIIHNGVDVEKYFPQSQESLAVRRELGVPPDALLIGCVGRFVPEKGYEVMLRALAIALEKLSPDNARHVHFMAVGAGITFENAAFMALADGRVPQERMHLLGKRADVPRLLSALDVYVLPSVSEAFPNALVEAMATGLACIATDVGECREILPAVDCVVSPNDPLGLATSIVRLLEMSRQERLALGAENRERIVTRFGLNRMVANLDALFEDAAAGNRAPTVKMVHKS